MNAWELWLKEFISLDRRWHGEGKPLTVREEHQHEYLRNLLEAALGTKSTLQEDNRRSDPRIPIALPVMLSWENGQSEAFTIDLSWGGMHVDEASLPSEIANMKVRLVMEREGVDFEAAGRIAWRSEDGMGIQFEKLTEEQKHAMGEILSKMIVERLEELLIVKLGKDGRDIRAPVV